MSYENNLNCEYNIMARPQDYVAIQFENPFELESSNLVHFCDLFIPFLSILSVLVGFLFQFFMFVPLRL